MPENYTVRILELQYARPSSAWISEDFQTSLSLVPNLVVPISKTLSPLLTGRINSFLQANYR